MAECCLAYDSALCLSISPAPSVHTILGKQRFGTLPRVFMGRVSVVGKAIHYGLDGPGI